MTRADERLPVGFELLEPFAARWATSDMAERAQRRGDSTDAERQAFYAAFKDMLPAALEHLDRKPLADLDAGEARLMSLVLAFAHVALAVEVQAGDEAKHARAREHLVITRASKG